jgi:hypothetical protein
MNITKGFAAVAIATAALGLTACGGSVSIGGKTLDNGELQTDLAAKLAESAGVKASTVSVKCPDGQKIEKGHTFDCTLTDKSDDTQYVVNVTETNDDGDYTAELAKQAGKTATS